MRRPRSSGGPVLLVCTAAMLIATLSERFAPPLWNGRILRLTLLVLPLAVALVHAVVAPAPSDPRRRDQDAPVLPAASGREILRTALWLLLGAAFLFLPLIQYEAFLFLRVPAAIVLPLAVDCAFAAGFGLVAGTNKPEGILRLPTATLAWAAFTAAAFACPPAANQIVWPLRIVCLDLFTIALAFKAAQGLAALAIVARRPSPAG